MQLNMAQTWHQVRPGEVRVDCGGCHAHSMQPLDFELTEASKPGYQVHDLTKTTPLLKRNEQGELEIFNTNSGVVNVEFIRDIRPILQRSCTPCHTESNPNPPAQLVLDDLENVDGLPGDYYRLAADSGADFGIPPLVTVGGNPVWRQTNASRYIRKFQSRRSLLMWKIMGMRTDGWTNEDHPSASIPGDPNSLPEGASINESDLDFNGTQMPPPGSGVQPLTNDEKMMFARWIDLGCPIDTGNPDYGWHMDDLRPTLTISKPRQNENLQALNEIMVGFADVNSGLDMSTLQITADFEVNGLAPGTNLFGAGEYSSDGVYRIQLNTPILELAESHLIATIFDNQGNKNVIDTRFWIDSSVLMSDKVLKHILGIQAIPPEEMNQADSNQDTEISISDLVHLNP